MSKIFIGGGILANLYHWVHPNVPEDRIPYWFKRLIIGEMTFTSQGGGMDYFTPDFLKYLGSKISINDFPKKNNY